MPIKFDCFFFFFVLEDKIWLLINVTENSAEKAVPDNKDKKKKRKGLDHPRCDMLPSLSKKGARQGQSYIDHSISG